MPRRLIIIIVCVAVVAAGLLYWLIAGRQVNTARGFPPAVVSATEVINENWQPVLRSVGSLVAINGINLSTEVNGIVDEIVFESGARVEKGQVLVKLETSVDRAALDALRAERRLSEIQFQRAGNLLKKKVVSKSEYDEAQARFDAANARVKQQEAQLNRKVIRAPFTGLAGIRQVSLGQYIEAGQTIVSLQALDPLYVDYTLAERYSSRVRKGQATRVKLDALPGAVFDGEVSAVNAGIDTGTRTLKIRATLANPDGKLLPGMFAQVETITATAEQVLTLPRTAVSFNTYGNFVFVISKNDKGALSVKRTAVTTGEQREGRVSVSGLQAGTRVVRSGLVKLRDGAAIIIDNQVKLDDAGISGE